VLTARFFSRWIPSNSTVLDLGCGYGEFINNIAAATKYGLDLNPQAARHVQPNVQLLQQDCCCPWPLPDACLDVVFTSNFFEHLSTKTALEETIRQAARCIKPGGLLIALGPNIKYVPGQYWDFYDHYLPLTELSLAEVLRKCGFSIRFSAARFLPYTMSNGRRYPLWTLRAYLACPFAWRFFGKQFLIVAEKQR
jgi:SAM-dependent methyltransferase